MTDALQVALVGVGRIAQQAHIPAWAQTKGAIVRWVVDSREQVAQEAAEAWGVSRWTTDYRDVLSDDAIQAVDVCTPAVTHSEICSAFLRQGRHVLVEKPAALYLRDLEAMQELAEETGAVLMVAENWPFSTAVVRVREVLQRDGPWEPILLEAWHETALRLWLPDPSPREMGDRNWLGYLFTAGIHSLNLARYLVGEIESLAAFSTSATPGPHYPLDDDLVLAARFTGGAIGSFSFTGRSRHVGERRLGFRLVADRGVVEVDILTGKVEVHMEGEEAVYKDVDPSMGYKEEIDHFVHCITTSQQPLTSARDHLRTMAVVVAAYESLQEGTVVSPYALFGSEG